ncbi:MAG: ABC transporter substrate-binding protein [Chloroflexi bacterium]|nr:ABC transporter substrate-binding protein [Chloroflexota bacterium]
MIIRLASGAGTTFGLDDLPCAAATEMGFWQDEGLAAEWVPVRGGLAAVEALLAGQVDVAYGAYTPALLAAARGEAVRIFASMSLGLAQALVARESVADAAHISGLRWGVDGIGAMSHMFGRQIVRAMGLNERTIDWKVVGPPPERIAALAAGDVDLSLIRFEESIWAPRTYPELRCLMSFAELQRLVPHQIHGVLSTTTTFAREQPHALAGLARGMLHASRTLHDDADAFMAAMRQANQGRGDLSQEDLAEMWRAMHDSGAFAVNGGMSDAHWLPRWDQMSWQYPDFAPAAPWRDALSRAPMREALSSLGPSPARFDERV